MPITIESKIASGSSGSIFKVVSERNGTKEYQALKISQNKRGIIKNLLEIILHFNTCPYLINSIDYEIDHNYKKIYMPLGICNMNKAYKYKLNIMDILFQICLGVKYLHDLKIVHGDIKPSNILLFRNKKGVYIPKIADFNLSYICLNKIKGVISYTKGYRAPEVLELNEYDLKSDIWALGQTLKKIVSVKNYEINKLYFDELIKGMLEIDSNKRWDIDQIIDSNFFKINRENLNLSCISTELSKSKSYDYTQIYQDIYNYSKNIIDIEEENMNIIISKLFGSFNLLSSIHLISSEIIYCKILITFFQIYIF